MKKKKSDESVIEELLKPLNDFKELNEYIPLLKQILNNVSINEKDNFMIEDFFQECFITLYSIVQKKQNKKEIEKELMNATKKVLKEMRQSQQFFDKIPDELDPVQTKELDDTLANVYMEQLKRNLPPNEGALLDFLYIKIKPIKEAAEALNLTVYKTNYLKEKLLEHVRSSIKEDAILLNEYQKLMLDLYKKHFNTSDKNCTFLIDFFQLLPETLYKSYYLFENNSLALFLQWAKKVIDSTPQYHCYSQYIFYDCLKYQENYETFRENPARFIKQYRQEIYERCFSGNTR